MVRAALSAAEAKFVAEQIGTLGYIRAEPHLRERREATGAIACLHNSTTLHAALSDIFGGTSAYRAAPRAELTVNKVKKWHRDLGVLEVPNPYFAFEGAGNDSMRLFSTGPDGEAQSFVVALMYMQDHSAAGDNGALTLRPGTHHASHCCRADGTCPPRFNGGGDHERQISAVCHHQMAAEVTVHPSLGDVVLADYNVVHRSTDHMTRGQKRALITLGYHAQDNAFSDAADRYYALKHAAQLGGLCSSHKGASSRSCLLAAGTRDLQREPLPTRAQRCDPDRPPHARAARGLRRGCPLAVDSLDQVAPQYVNARKFLSRNMHMRAQGEGKIQGTGEGKRPLRKRAGALRAMVVGASRGIGLELVRQLALDSTASVHATSRSAAPEAPLAEIISAAQGRVKHCQLDVTNRSQLMRLAEQFDTTGDALDVLIHSAGLTPSAATGNDALERSMRTNADAPLAVAEAMLPSLMRSNARLPLLCLITSASASHKRTLKYCQPKRQNCSMVLRPYVASKQALNDRFRSSEPSWRSQGVTAFLIDPGWVKTEGGGPGAQISVEDSVHGMLQVLRSRTKAAAGEWVDWNGRRIPW